AAAVSESSGSTSATSGGRSAATAFQSSSPAATGAASRSVRSAAGTAARPQIRSAISAALLFPSALLLSGARPAGARPVLLRRPGRFRSAPGELRLARAVLHEAAHPDLLVLGAEQRRELHPLDLQAGAQVRLEPAVDRLD